MLFIFGRVIVGLGVSFVVGVFLFLTGVRGMMVAFLYVVALCPNPVFKASEYRTTYGEMGLTLMLVGLVFPTMISLISLFMGYGLEFSNICESTQ